MISISTTLAASILAGIAFTDIYVDGSAPNCATGSGTAADPVCSIPEAVALASSGDTIRIAPGVYTQHAVISFDLSLIGTGGQDVTFLQGSGGQNPLLRIESDATVSIEGLTLRNNEYFRGGAIHVSESNVTLIDSTLSGNNAPPSGFGLGGAIYAILTNQTLTIDGCTIRDNYAGRDGGGVACFGGTLVIRNSTISGNGADVPGPFSLGYGGGIRAATRLVITNSTISGNRASKGGGIDGVGSLGSLLTNVTITENRPGYGAGARFFGVVSFHNTVIAGNDNTYYPSHAGSGYSQLSLYSSGSSFGHNFIGNANRLSSLFVDGVLGDRIGTYADPLDPLLAPLADNGGPTLTHAPLPGSLLVDAGDPIVSRLTDQRGNPRPVGVASDIGAIELDPFESHCHGDGGDQLGCSGCPCGNNSAAGTIGGCMNRTGSAARLFASGELSVSAAAGSSDDLRLSLLALPPGSFSVLVSGAALAPTSPSHPCFGLDSGITSANYDGLRCAAQGVRRHGGRAANSSGEIGVTNNPWGGEGPPAVGLAQAFGGFAAGERRFFQAIYREDPLTVCMRGLNTSQAIEVTWTP